MFAALYLYLNIGNKVPVSEDCQQHGSRECAAIHNHLNAQGGMPRGRGKRVWGKIKIGKRGLGKWKGGKKGGKGGRRGEG